jgi:hypothetical protein
MSVLAGLALVAGLTAITLAVVLPIRAGWRYCQVWRWTTKLAVKYHLFDDRRRSRARVNVGPLQGGDPPEHGWCIPRGVTRASDGRLIPRQLRLWTGLGVKDDDLAEFLRWHHHYTNEVWTRDLLEGTRWLELTIAPPMPAEPPPPPLIEPEDRPWLIPLGAGRVGPVDWDVAADDPLHARSPDTLSPHALCVAESGWGKSELVKQVCGYCTASGRWRVLVIDPEGEHDHPGAARTIAQQLALLRTLAHDMDEMTRLHESGKQTYAQQIADRGRVLLVIDELPEVMEPPRASDPDKQDRQEIIRLIEDTARRGRKRGVAIFAAGTEFRVDKLGPVRDLFALIIGGGLNANAYRALFGRQPPHRQHTRTGLGWVRTRRDLVELQTYIRQGIEPVTLRRTA